MTKILNLDDISIPEEKVITLKGERHVFQPLSVGKFIEQLKRIEDMAKTETVGAVENIEHSLEMITTSFPTLTLEKLKDLNKDQIDAIGRFIRGELLTEAVEGAATATNEPVEDTKKE